MKHLLTSCLLIIIHATCFMQSVHQLSVEDAVQMALANSDELKNLELDYKIQELKNKEVVASAMPQINATGQLNYYFALPQIQFPSSNFGIYEVLQKEGVKDGNGNAIDISKASFAFQNVSFFAPLNLQFGLGLSQVLFQPDLFIAYKAREEVLNLASNNTAIAREKVKEAVKKSYYQVLISEKQKSVLQETILRLKNLTGQMEQMYKQGFVEKLDVDKLQVSINNTQTALNQITNGIGITKYLLKASLGLPMSDSLYLTDNLNLDQLRAQLMIDEAAFAYENRKEINMLSVAQKLEALNLQRHKFSYFPTVAFFANYGRNGQRNEKFNPNDPWFWYGTGILGLSINQPIFDGGQRRFRIAQSKLSAQKIENSITQVKRFIDMEKDIAKSSLQNAILNLDVQQRNIDLAQNVFNTAKKKYEAGLGSSFELIQAETELQRAQGGFFQALYEGYVARTAWDKAIGKL